MPQGFCLQGRGKGLPAPRMRGSGHEDMALPARHLGCGRSLRGMLVPSLRGSAERLVVRSNREIAMPMPQADLRSPGSSALRDRGKRCGSMETAGSMAQRCCDGVSQSGWGMASVGRRDEVWQLAFGDELLTGHAEIDGQHRRLVDQFNSLTRLAGEADVQSAHLEGIFVELEAYTRYHFGTEERLMRDSRVDPLHRRVHHDAHLSFVRFVRRAKEVAHVHPRETASYLALFLGQWLLHHIMHVDRELVDCLDRETRARPAQDDFASALIHINSDLYNLVGQHVFQIFDVNARLETEAEHRAFIGRVLEEMQAVYRKLLAIGSELISSLQPADAAMVVCRNLGCLGLFDDVCVVSGAFRDKRAVFGFAGDRAFAEWFMRGTPADVAVHPLERVLESRQALLWNAQVGESRSADARDSRDLQSPDRVFAVPIFRQEQVFAVLGATLRRGTKLEDEVRDLVLQIARQLGLAFEQIELRHVLEHQRDEQRYMAYHDSLTGLTNRLGLEEEVERMVADARAGSRWFTLALIDLDHFKPINDAWGHGVGDQLLRQLSERLQASLEPSEVLARLGGDEFVVLARGLKAEPDAPGFQRWLGRLDRAIEAPFVLGDQHTATISMSVGIAGYPSDGEDFNTLLRVADGAMFRAKDHKAGGSRWWRIGQRDEGDAAPASEIDPFGSEAALLLGKHAQSLALACPLYTEEFAALLKADVRNESIIERMADDSLDSLARRQSEHFACVLSPELTRAELVERASRIGEVHALLDVRGSKVFEAYSRFERCLRNQLEQMPMRTDHRERVLQVVSKRFVEDFAQEITAQEEVITSSFLRLSSPVPTAGSLADRIAVELDRAAGLPGVVAALLFAVGPQNQLRCVQASGADGQTVAAFLNDPAHAPVLDPRSGRGNTAAVAAWLDAQVHVTDRFHHDPIYDHWKDEPAFRNFQSIVGIPLVNASGRVIRVLSLAGRYPNQFRPAWYQRLVTMIRDRWVGLWDEPAREIPQIEDHPMGDIRLAFYSDRIQPFVQPIMAFASGEVTRVEVLARLRLDDGRILTPDRFLHLLSEDDLWRMFQKMMVVSSRFLAEWRESGRALALSINVPPSICVREDLDAFVLGVLEQHRLPVDALVLELLEAGSVDEHLLQESTTRLAGHGLHLELDDLGSGFSSLVRFLQLPFAATKIDRGITLELRKHPDKAMGLIEGIIDIATAFSRPIVIEGLEDAGMVEACGVLGVDYGQGYYLARPMAAEDFPRWLDQYRAPPPDRRIRSFLGALAIAWATHRSITEIAKLGPLEVCPLTHFLRQVRGPDCDAEALHAAIHDGGRNAAIEALKLIEWLVQEAVREGGTPGEAPSS